MARVTSILTRQWSRLRSSYWFLPTLIIASCAVLAYLMLYLDRLVPLEYLVQNYWVYTRDPAGARALLSVVSQSMITVAGVVFSVTVVALALASNQFGTRVLKSFARDVGNQVALGTLLGTFLYGILIMRRVESDKPTFVPSLGVAFAVLLAIFSLLVLIYFIHHVIVEIQAENVVAAVADDLYEIMDGVLPEERDDDGKDSGNKEKDEPLSAKESERLKSGGAKVCSDEEGFVQSINHNRLVHLARDRDAVVHLQVRAGEFVSNQTVLAKVWSDPSLPDRDLEKFQDCVAIGAQRSYEEDIGFGLNQLGLIAVRSLSPALNAVGTANDAIERLIASFVHLGARKIPSLHHRDEDGCLRLEERAWDFDRLLSDVLDPLRQAAASNVSVVANLVSQLTDVIPRVKNPEIRRILEIHLDHFAASGSGFDQEFDRQRVQKLYEKWKTTRAA